MGNTHWFLARYPTDPSRVRTDRATWVLVAVVSLTVIGLFIWAWLGRSEPDRLCTFAMDTIRHGHVVPVHPSNPDPPWCK